MKCGQKQEEIPVRVSLGESLAVHWAALLCSQDNLSHLRPHIAEAQVLAWAATHLDAATGIFSGGRQPLSEVFLTVRFQERAKSLESGLEPVRYIFRCLRTGDVAFVKAMTMLAQVFNGEETRLVHWKAQVEDRPRFLHWLSAFENSYQYLINAYPTPAAELERIKKELLAASTEPQRFLDGRERQQFGSSFDEFKKGYVEYYQAAHEDTVHIIGNQAKMESKVDSVALRNLELLSDLDLADKSYLNRVRAIGKWLQSHQCDLPVREILARQPRCYCNFNPAGSRHLAESVEQMNEAIRQGIDHFRSILRKCKMLIIQELKAMGTDDQHSKQIAALLSRGQMIPLKQQSVSILNMLMKKHAEAFRSASTRHQAADVHHPLGW
jgi:hypothetical protein